MREEDAMKTMSTQPVYPQDFEDEEFYAEQQAIAEADYQRYLTERGISEEEHLVEILDWCDRQD